MEPKTAQKRWRARKMDWLSRVKENAGCFRCGESDRIVLDFHHLEEKTRNRKRGPNENGYKRLVWHRLNWSEIGNEIQRCIVLCANCHRREEEYLRG